MRKSNTGRGLVGVAVAALAVGVAQGQVFEADFVQGQPSPAQCTDWQAFQAELVPQDYTLLTVSGSNDPDGVTCSDPDAIAAIAAALNTGGTLSIACDGRTWNVGACGGGSELSANGSTCQCTNPGHIVRPCIGNLNWGGVNGPTCSAASQTLRVEFEAGPPEPTACCLGDATCEMLLPADCEDRDGVVKRGETCDDAVCEGACCMDDESCEVLSEQRCAAAGGEYNEGLGCEDVNCEIPCIDLFDAGTFDQSSWGRPNTVIYAQSVLACGGNVSEVRMRATHTGGNDIMFNLVITGTRSGGGGLGQEPDFNDIRYTSNMQTIPAGGGLTEVTINPNQSVNEGELLWMVFESFSYPNSGVGTMRATPFNGGQDLYPDGEFVFANLSGEQTLQDFNNAGWGHRQPNNQDLGISVAFGGTGCGYLLKKSKSKGGCEACPDVGSIYSTSVECEKVKDCVKKVKATIDCPDGGAGICKIKGKRSVCEQ